MGHLQPSNRTIIGVAVLLAKLSELQNSGALTDDEFSREKAKLLAELS